MSHKREQSLSSDNFLSNKTEVYKMPLVDNRNHCQVRPSYPNSPLSQTPEAEDQRSRTMSPNRQYRADKDHYWYPYHHYLPSRFIDDDDEESRKVVVDSTSSRVPGRNQWNYWKSSNYSIPRLSCKTSLNDHHIKKSDDCNDHLISPCTQSSSQRNSDGTVDDYYAAIPRSITTQDSEAVPSHKLYNDRDLKIIRRNDVLCGRGIQMTYHEGNQYFNRLVTYYESQYVAARRSEKSTVAKIIVDTIHQTGGRFMKKIKIDDSEGKNTCRKYHISWKELNDDQAYEKTCQALRDNAIILREKVAQKERHKIMDDLTNRKYSFNDQHSRTSISACKNNVSDGRHHHHHHQVGASNEKEGSENDDVTNDLYQPYNLFDSQEMDFDLETATFIQTAFL